MSLKAEPKHCQKEEGGLHTLGMKKESLPCKPLVSVITVVFNRAHALEATLKSVLDQTYNNVQYIVIDGGSTDGTLEFIKKYSPEIDYWLSESDNGIYDAMNKAIVLATGEWINFMNCGDRFYSENVIKTLFENKNYSADVIYGDAMVEYPTFQTPWKKVELEQMWKRTPFCHQASFVKASLMKEYKFDLQYRLSSDFDFLYKVYQAGRMFLYVPELICSYDYKDGASIQHEFRSLRERKRAVLSHGFALKKWIYYARVSIYIRSTSFIKKMIGKKVTAWVTQFLKQ